MKYTFTDLKNKVVVITGGNGLLGTQFVKTFLSVISKVVILDLLIKKKTKNVYSIKCDITDEEDVKKNLIKIKKKYQKIDILINNASNNYAPKKTNSNKSFFLENFWNFYV